MRFKQPASTPSYTLISLIAAAKSHKMTREERIAQRRSWVRGEMMMSHPEMSAEQVNDLMDKVLPELSPGPNLADATKKPTP